MKTYVSLRMGIMMMGRVAGLTLWRWMWYTGMWASVVLVVCCISGSRYSSCQRRCRAEGELEYPDIAVVGMGRTIDLSRLTSSS